eukprot:TRINITY_DN10679_c0_g1_i2.p3 TRINITY_DN10679_c0_g1~~TRINITY_DN10679_c0_g1_i2.p3  ORF type:complete len:105 (-),score=3.48 TRINITY_DN10679_c0_g1_i2:173-487(-)
MQQRKVWINIFQLGKQTPQNIEVGFDTSEDFHTYTATWNESQVIWWVDGNVKRYEKNVSFKRPMYLFISVTGNSLWSGQVDWSKFQQPIFAEFKILQTPNVLAD